MANQTESPWGKAKAKADSKEDAPAQEAKAEAKPDTAEKADKPAQTESEKPKTEESGSN